MELAYSIYRDANGVIIPYIELLEDSVNVALLVEVNGPVRLVTANADVEVVAVGPEVRYLEAFV